MNQNYYYIAQYNCNSYGASAYGECSVSTSSNNASSSGLANTGYDVIIPVALGLALIVAGAILLVRRSMRRARQED